MNGKKVSGGSSFKKHFTEEFNPSMAYGLAKAWKCSADDIKGIWEMNSELARDVGTAIHHMRETKDGGEKHDYYTEAIKAVRIADKRFTKYKDVGEKIYNGSESIKKKPFYKKVKNYAYSKHIELQWILFKSDKTIRDWMDKVEQGFIDIDEFIHNELVPECYVTYSPLNMGGEVDRLVIVGEPSDKVCDIEDYKFQHSISVESSNNKLINELLKKKATKLDQIQIQLSFYAFCLYKAGWKVRKARVYGREGKWNKYEVPLIPMDEMEKLLTKYLKK